MTYTYLVQEVNMLKNRSTLAVSVPINHSIKFSFVSVNCPRETYFVDALCIKSTKIKFKNCKVDVPMSSC